MADPTLTTPPSAPVRGDAPDVFATKSNVFVGFFSTMVTELTAMISWISTTAGQVDTDKQTTTSNVTATNSAKDTAVSAANTATTKAGEAGSSASAAALSKTGADSAKTIAEQKAAEAATSAASVDSELIAPLASPALTGIPTAPTANIGTKTEQLATTEYLLNTGMGEVDLQTNNLWPNSGLNNISGTATGFYHSFSKGDSPNGLDGDVLVVHSNATLRKRQTFFSRTNNSVFTRFSIDGGASWYDWVEFITSYNEQQIGVGQAWQNVTTSRSASINYTNSTGKPIMVSISTNEEGTLAEAFIDGTLVARLNDSSSDMSTTSFIVPSGSIYRIDGLSGDLNEVWSELR